MDVAFLDDGSILVCWLARAEGPAELRCRRVSSAGDPGEIVVVAELDDSRSSGFPTITTQGMTAVLAWTDVRSDPVTVRSAAIDFR